MVVFQQHHYHVMNHGVVLPVWQVSMMSLMMILDYHHDHGLYHLLDYRVYLLLDHHHRDHHGHLSYLPFRGFKKRLT